MTSLPAWPFGGKDHIFRHGQIVVIAHMYLYMILYIYIYSYMVPCYRHEMIGLIPPRLVKSLISYPLKTISNIPLNGKRNALNHWHVSRSILKISPINWLSCRNGMMGRPDSAFSRYDDLWRFGNKRMILGQLVSFTKLNLAAIKGDDSL